MEYHKRSFRGETVLLDGSRFAACDFVDCVLEYHGTGPVDLTECTLADCRFDYRGSAQATIGFLRSVAGSGAAGLDHILRMLLADATIDWGGVLAELAGQGPPR